MIVTLSPAKLLDFNTSIKTTQKSQPSFLKQTDQLITVLKEFTADQIMQLMNINPKIALEVYQYTQAFDLPQTPQRQAIFAYNGIAYKGLDAHSLNDKDLEFAQNHLISISALYGLLRPLDLIKPYRLEFSIKLATDKGRTLYDFWGDQLTKGLSDRMLQDDNSWLNVASAEYSKSINRKILPKGAKIINATFKEETSQGPKMIVVYAKKARGLMARYVIENKITKIEDVKNFDTEGYRFSPSLSDDRQWVFTR